MATKKKKGPLPLSGSANPNDNDPLSAKALWAKVEACRRVKKSDLIRNWQDSVQYRRGKPFKSVPPEDTVNVPADWARSKNKQAQLFYQIPELLLKARRPEWRPATAVFASALNFELTERVHAEHMMNECLADVINAAGVMVCKVGYEGSFEDTPFDAKPTTGEPPQPQTQQLSPVSGTSVASLSPEDGPEDSNVMPVDADTGGQPEGNEPPPGQSEPPPSTIPMPVYECYYARRISPLHFLWPIDFHGSNWQESPFLGWEGYMPVAVAKRMGWVDDTVEGVQIEDENWLLIREWTELKPADRYVKFVELFIKPYFYDAREKDPLRIRRVVLVEGGQKDSERSKVVDEDFRWQKKDPTTGRWVGMTTFPIKVATISHISDMAIPPSDSEMGRPQVRELIRSRSQMLRQRDHSLALRWFDVNQVDPEIADRLRKGKWQDMIPMNGPGDRAIGEVARAAFPQENWEFERVIRNDLDESWSMGQNQQGVNQSGDHTATEVNTVQSANDVRLDFERQWVLRFFLEVARGVGELMQMFADKEEYTYILGPNGEQTLEQWDKNKIQGEYIFEAKPDSQLRLDVDQARTQSLNLYKLLRKDPLIDPKELVSEVLELHAMDPSKMLVPPPPPPPDVAKVSYTFKGTDLSNPAVLAIIQKTPNPITVQDIQNAKQLIAAAGPVPQAPPALPGAPPNAGGPGGIMPPMGPQGPPHPGPADVVQPLNRRYSEQGSTGPEGSRDSGVPQLTPK